ncbi:hypothetical protein [Bacillus sp. CECT 9360]|uniref:hypothetical protein n=1 Tax=Bacillus sp. CECT 9360 TaxID=2845821 RepID=UPI001E575251|nr:hypothetical protein [Bacillus sp. CECT 9360]
MLKLNTTDLSQLYYRGSLVSYIIGMFLNIGVVPFVYQVIEKNLKDQAAYMKKRYIASLILRGYALCLVWSPMEILVGLTIDITGTSYLHLLPYLLAFSIILLMVDWLLAKKYKKYEIDISGQTNTYEFGILKNIIILLLYLMFFIIVVSLFRYFFDFDFLTSVTLMIVPYAVFWALTIKKLRFYLKYSVMVWKRKTATLQNYVVLFLGVGFFISILEETELLKYLQEPVIELGKTPIVLFLVIQIMFLFLANIGFHPLITMAIIGEAIQPIIGVVNPLSLGIVLITSGLSTVMAGPYNITVSITSILLDENPYKISLYNLKFALLFSSTGTFIALLIMWIF